MTLVSVAGQKQPIILCVEDEAQLRRDICDELVEAGYRVVEAGDGKQALEKLAQTRPDLILCDISMPILSGYDLLMEMQHNWPDTADIPFVFLSALADPKHVVDGKRLGADDYLVKPIDYDLLLATVEARLRQVGRIRSVRPAEPNIADFAVLAETFGLTPTEMRLAEALTQGKKLSHIAADFDVSRSTIAFHMSNIFQKTGTGRQAELVALLLKR